MVKCVGLIDIINKAFACSYDIESLVCVKGSGKFAIEDSCSRTCLTMRIIENDNGLFIIYMSKSEEAAPQFSFSNELIFVAMPLMAVIKNVPNMNEACLNGNMRLIVDAAGGIIDYAIPVVHAAFSEVWQSLLSRKM